MASVQPQINPSLKFTWSDYQLLPENDKRYEIMDGDLTMTPSPNTRHQMVLLNLATILKSFVEHQHLGQIFIAPYDVVLSKYDVVQPDIIFITTRHTDRVKSTHLEGEPDLVIEIMSTGTLQRDRIFKRKLYAIHGVSEYWLVHPEKETVQVLRREKGDFKSVAELTVADRLTSPLLPGLEIQLKAIFPG